MLMNRVAALEALFAHIGRTRMQGIPILHPGLRVQAVGFEPAPTVDGSPAHAAVGVLVTPWFMNLTLAPHDPARWRPLAQGEKRRYAFPAGEYEFIGAHDEVAGEYQVCSLFSPVLEFEDHATARLVAELAREALFDAENAEVPAMPEANLAPAVVAGTGPLAHLEEKLDAPLSKRDFLRGRFLAGDDDHRG